MAATESLIDYLRSMFPGNLRAIIPQIAMSAGTMIACACNQIVMGKHSSLGPIDPQINGMPAHAVVEEFNNAAEQIAANPNTIPLWQPIIAKYWPTLIGECTKAIDWAEEMVQEWLITGMFAGAPDAATKAARVVSELGSHALTKSHARHISLARARDVGLNVMPLESEQDLQEAVLSVHHCCVHTLTSTEAAKIVENQNGVAMIQRIAPVSLAR